MIWTYCQYFSLLAQIVLVWESLLQGIRFQEGRWKCYTKYIEQNLFGSFLSMQCIERGHLAVLAWSDCQEVMASRWFLWVNWRRRKTLNQFCSRYLEYFSQPHFCTFLANIWFDASVWCWVFGKYWSSGGLWEQELQLKLWVGLVLRSAVIE